MVLIQDCASTNRDYCSNCGCFYVFRMKLDSAQQTFTLSMILKDQTKERAGWKEKGEELGNQNEEISKERKQEERQGERERSSTSH